jgi:hypothetical protein
MEKLSTGWKRSQMGNIEKKSRKYKLESRMKGAASEDLIEEARRQADTGLGFTSQRTRMECELLGLLVCALDR